MRDDEDLAAHGQMHFNRTNRYAVLVLAFVALAYFLGAYSYKRNWFPISTLRAMKSWIDDGESNEVTTTKIDEYGRLAGFQGKEAIACPPWKDGTAVILAFGQSNAANSADTRVDYSHDPRLVNFYNGRCYLAASPLLGATGTGGEFLTTMSAMLLKAGKYSQIVLVPAGVGDSAVVSWQAGGPLNAMLLDVIAKVRREYVITHLIWHQGESDQERKTEAWRYVDRFESMLESVRDLGVDAPIFTAIATKCGRAPIDLSSPVRIAQAQLVERHSDIHLAIDSDSVLGDEDRAADQCHLSMSGVEKMAASYAEAILKRTQ